MNPREQEKGFGESRNTHVLAYIFASEFSVHPTGVESKEDYALILQANTEKSFVSDSS